eukprot:GILK01004052.1.p1 GENE.GILK01004052.1~~GILK01004052.1.p1  ORF type:complete len:392 (+),score=53.19 GILK01004052.1:50-1225(+)
MDRAWQRVCRILAQLPEGKMEHPQVETANTSSCNTDRVYGAVTVAEVDNQVVFTVRLNGEYKANKVEVSLDKTQGILNISALDDSSSPTRSFTLSLEFGAESLKPLDVRSTRATLSGSLLTVVIPKRRDQSNLAQQSEMIPVLQIDSSATVKCPSRGSLPEVAADPFSAMLQREGRTGGPGLGGCPFRNGMMDVAKAGDMKSCPFSGRKSTAAQAQQCPFMRAQAAKDGNSHASTPDQCQAPAQPQPSKGMQSECPYVRDMAAQGKPIDPARASMCPAKRQQLQQSSCPYVRQKAQEGQPLDMNKAAECPAATSRSTQPAAATTTNMRSGCPFSSNYASASSSSSSVSSSVGRAPSACPFANSTRAPTGTCPFRRTGTEMTAALIITSKQL